MGKLYGRLQRKKNLSRIKNKTLTQQDNLPKLDFVDISPKNKVQLLSKYKASFEKDQKLYDKLFEYEAKQVVHAQPRLSKAEVALLS